MEWSLLTTVFVLLLSIVSSRDHEEVSRLMDHIKYVVRFRCSDPQPRVVRVKDVLAPHLTQGKTFFPEVTVLHACDSCGTCQTHQTCGPLHSDTLHVQFNVTLMEDKIESWAWEYHAFVNHTKCACHPWSEERSTVPRLETSHPDYPVTPYPKTEHQKELERANLKYIASFPCHRPQPRVVNVTDVLAPHLIQGKTFFPQVTVIYTCDGCGSCDSQQVCGPLQRDDIHQLFKVSFVEDMGTYHKLSIVWKNYTFVNHTECACKPFSHRRSNVPQTRSGSSRRSLHGLSRQQQQTGSQPLQDN